MKRLDKFSILIENESMGKEVKRIADNAGVKSRWCFHIINGYYHFDNNEFYTWAYEPIHHIITLSEFKQMFEPEIIGWKIKDIKYKNPICKLCGFNVWDGYFKIGAKRIELFKELGVLDLWFDPIYKESSKTVMVDYEKELAKAVAYGLGYFCSVNCLSPTNDKIKEIAEKYAVDTYKELNK